MPVMRMLPKIRRRECIQWRRSKCGAIDRQVLVRLDIYGSPYIKGIAVKVASDSETGAFVDLAI